MTEKCVTYTDDLSDPGIYKLVSHIMTCIEVPVHIYVAVTSILSIYENRYYVLFGKDKNQLWCQIRKYFLSLNYFFAITFVIPLVLGIPDQAYGLQRAIETLNCIPEQFINEHEVFVAAVDFKPTIGCLAFESVSLTIEILTFLFIIFVKLSLQDKTKTASVSNRTRKFQKRFVIAICLQTLVPIALLMSPVFYVLISVVLNYRNQTFINLCFLIGSSHGVLSTIVMVFIHQPYRDATFDLGYFLIGKRGRRRTKSSGPHSSVVRI